MDSLEDPTELLVPKCVLHVGMNVSNEKIIPFTTESLKICHEKKAIRDKESKRKSKYDAIVLPDSPDTISGYHPSCYRYYTSIRSKKQAEAAEMEAMPMVSNSVQSVNEITTLVSAVLTPNSLEDDQNDDMWIDDAEQSDQESNIKIVTGCAFCNRRIRSRNRMPQKLTRATTETKTKRILEILLHMNQQFKVNELQHSKCIEYHLSCLAEHEHKISTAKESIKVETIRKKVHNAALLKVKEYVQETLIEKREVRWLNDIFHYYAALFEEQMPQTEDNLDELLIKPHYLSQILLKLFPTLTKTTNKQRTYLHMSSLSTEEVYSNIFQKQNDLISQCKKVAFEIRKIVKGMRVQPLPIRNCTLKDVIEGECEIPRELYALIEALVKGPRSMNNVKKEKKISSICNAIILTMTNGHVKPSTCITLGLTMKSITGSRKVINILNRMGFSINYMLVEELETELAYGSSQDHILPYGLVSQNSNLRTHVAFDNFDKYVETTSGKDTLHDTVGIVYQNICQENCFENERVVPCFDDNNNTDKNRRRRKFYSNFDSSIEAYSKPNQKPPSTLFATDPLVPESWQKAVDMNNMWMMTHALDTNEKKRWFAWHSERIIDNNPVQNIGYLPNLNMSPTVDAVVLKTLQIAQNILRECKQKYIIVTYDLAIASKAYRIQADLAPRFDNIFITMGAFHIELAFFKLIGKFIDSSGIPKLMIESGILAEGSINGVLRGTHFNRCKKLHVITALGFKILNFKAFLQQYQEEKNHADIFFVNEIIEILENNNKRPTNTDETLRVMDSLFRRYDEYKQKTLDGKHGKTAQFVLMYVSFIELYQLFEYAIRCCDFNLYVYVASKMCPLFFALSHQNYARWLTRNVDDLINIETTHPELLQEFQNGALSIRRTTKNFCRSPVDLTLEQTINANAANKLTGISSFTNSIYARQRWSETHSIRTRIISHLLDSLNLNKISEGTDQYQSKVFNRQLQKFLDEIGKNIDPFCKDINPNKLFNLTSGMATSDDTAEFLTSVELNGMKQMKEFIKACHEDSSRFEQPIKRNTVKNFAAEKPNTKRKLHKRDDEAKLERNILGKVLCFAMNNDIDLESVLSYPLATTPHSFAHFENYLNSNKPKGELTTFLISKNDHAIDQQANKPHNIEVEIIDGFYFLSKFQDLPVKYGTLAKFLLEKVCDSNVHEIHLIFDHHKSPSPKDAEMRKYRELYDTPNFKITGPNQERNKAMAKCLQSISFREELVMFLIQFWSKDDLDESILNGKRVFLSFGDKCYLFSKDLGRGQTLSLFKNNHFEIESKVIFHMYKIRAANVCIKISKTDAMLVYLLYHCQFWPNERKIWIETGDINKNTNQVINVRHIHDKLSSILINALPAWYIFTGCSYEPSFYGKGCKTCIKTLEKKVEYQTVFGKVGSAPDLYDEDIASLERFTCQIYGSNSTTVNNARCVQFQKAYGSMNKDFSKTGLDFKNLPPSKSVLLHKIERTIYLARMIKCSSENFFGVPQKGWMANENGELEIEYFSGAVYPESIADMTYADENSDNDDECQRSSDDEEDSDGNSSDDDD